MPAAIVQHPSSQPGTTNRTIVQDLMASLTARRGVPGGTTVGDFVHALVGAVPLDLPLASIEWGVSQLGNGRLVIDTSPDGVEIREGRS